MSTLDGPKESTRVLQTNVSVARMFEPPAKRADPPVLLAALAWARREVRDVLSPARNALGDVRPTVANEATVAEDPAPPPPPLGPRNLVLRLPITRALFPDINNVLETGPNTKPVGDPIASRQVILNNRDDDNLRVTYAVDVYRDEAAAKAAFDLAIAASEGAEGFERDASFPSIGDQTLAGWSSGTDPVTGVPLRHYGAGVRVGNVIIGVTRAGYEVDDATIRKVIFLTRLQALKASLLAHVYGFLGYW